MTIPTNLRVSTNANFPSLVKGSGPIQISKANGIWTVQFSFSDLGAYGKPAIASPYVMVYDSYLGTYGKLPINSGISTIDFGSFPGSFDTSLAVTGQLSITESSAVTVGVFGLATDDHTVDEHLVDPPLVTVGSVTAGTGFTIYAQTRDGSRSYGKWNVAWIWF